MLEPPRSAVERTKNLIARLWCQHTFLRALRAGPELYAALIQETKDRPEFYYEGRGPFVWGVEII